MKKFLYNRFDKETLLKKIEKDTRERRVISFYRYVKIQSPKEFRDLIYDRFEDLGILGRIYLAEEGINAQFSIPVENYDLLRSTVDQIPELKGIYFNDAVEDKKESFIKLAIKVRKKIVADGLNDSEFDPSDVGTHLTPLEFHKTLEDPDVVVVDLRNNYESEVGHFENAILPDVGTFREELPLVEEILEEHKDKKILLYCTGGIRCEKASAYLKYKGFQNVHQLLGGIINYAKMVKDTGLKSKFKGKNFVFDDRLGERVTDDVLSVCYTCGKTEDTHTNCANLGCHVLYIQCKDCREKFSNCCSMECKETLSLPIEDQKSQRKELRKIKYPTHHLTRKLVGR